MSTRRSKRWEEVHADLSAWWGTTPWTKGRSLTKSVDSNVAWSALYDLKSIHLNEYREPEDAEVRAAMTDARRAVSHLANAMFRREQNRRAARIANHPNGGQDA